MIINTVDIEGVSLMGSAGFLIVCAVVNLAAIRLVGETRIGPRSAHRAASETITPADGKALGPILAVSTTKLMTLFG